MDSNRRPFNQRSTALTITPQTFSYGLSNFVKLNLTKDESKKKQRWCLCVCVLVRHDIVFKRISIWCIWGLRSLYCIWKVWKIKLKKKQCVSVTWVSVLHPFMQSGNQSIHTIFISSAISSFFQYYFLVFK